MCQVKKRQENEENELGRGREKFKELNFMR